MDKHPLKTPRPSKSKLPDSYSALLKNSEIKIDLDFLKKKPKSIKSPSSKIKQSRKKSSEMKETQSVLSFQVGEINKLKKEKLNLECYIYDLESKLKKYSFLPGMLKDKQKKIHKLKNSLKRISEKAVKKKETTLKTSYSQRITPKIKYNPIRFEETPKSYRHQSSKTIMSVPTTVRNSQSFLHPVTLNDILMKTEEVLSQWRNRCDHK